MAQLCMSTRSLGMTTAAVSEKATPGEHVVDMDMVSADTCCEILIRCDFGTALALSGTNRKFRYIFIKYFRSIVQVILSRDFAPKEALDKIIDEYTKLLGCSSEPHSANVYHEGRLLCRRAVPEHFSIRLDLEKLVIINICHTVKGWEAFFPSLRLASHHQCLRSLSVHEAERLRLALYNWWLYALKFHGYRSRENFGFSMPGVVASSDERAYYTRSLSTAQLVELRDLYDTVTNAVATKLCPSVSKVHDASEPPISFSVAASVAWGTDRENDAIVATVMKLLPGDLLHLFQHQHRYASRSSLITAIRLRHPAIENSTESLDRALCAAMGPRERFVKPRAFIAPHGRWGFPAEAGGILDYGRLGGFWEKVRKRHDKDGDASSANTEVDTEMLAMDPLFVAQWRVSGNLDPTVLGSTRFWVD